MSDQRQDETFGSAPAQSGSHSALGARSRRAPFLSVQGVLGMLGLVATLFFIYSPALNGEFFFDDSPYLIENPQYQLPGALREIWGTLNFPDYWPVSYSLFLAEIKLFGTTDPWGYHVVNLMLHLFNAVLLWRILVSVGWRGAYGTAWLFAVHPLATESVAWIFQTRTTLSAFWALISIACALAYERSLVASGEEPSPKLWLSRLLYGASFVTFGISLLAKPATASLPLFLWITGILWGRRSGMAYARRLAPFFALSLAMSALTYIKQNADRAPTVADFDLLGQVARSWWTYLFYSGKVLLPTSLRLMYPRLVVPETIALVSLGVTGAGVLVLTRASWGRGSRGYYARLALWGILGTLSLLAPALNMVRSAYQDLADVADRYAYMVLPLGAMLMVAMVSWIGDLGRRPSVRIGGILLLGFLGSYGTWSYAHHFQTAKGAWDFVLQDRPDLALAWYSRGRLKVQEKDYAGATSDLNRALELNPNYHQALLTLAILRAIQGQLPEAMPLFLRSFALAPQSVDARQNLRAAWLGWVSLAQERQGRSGGIKAAQQGMEWARKVGFESLAQELQDIVSAMTKASP